MNQENSGRNRAEISEIADVEAHLMSKYGAKPEQIDQVRDQISQALTSEDVNALITLGVKRNTAVELVHLQPEVIDLDRAVSVVKERFVTPKQVAENIASELKMQLSLGI